MTAGDVARLPKWAQRLIGRQEAEIERLRRALTPATDSPVYVFGGGGERRPLDRYAEIAFQLPDSDPTCPITVRLHSRGYVEVVSNHGAIVAQPQASNVLRISQGEWW